MIKSCWGGNHRQRPEFATLAKQLEADVIVLKLSSPVVFQVAKYANLPEKLPNFQVDSNTVSLNILEKAKALSASKDTSPTVNAVNQPTTDLKNLKKAPKKFEAHKPAKSIIFKFRAMTKAKKLLLVVAIFVVLAAISGIILAVTVSGNKGVSTLNQIFTLSTTSATSTTLSITGFTTSFSTPIPGPTPTHYCQTNYTNPVVSTFAGNGISVEDDTPLLSASFTDPLGIAITPENDFIVTENGSRKRILKIISKNNTVSRMIINHPLSLNYDFVPGNLAVREKTIFLAFPRQIIVIF